MLGNFVSGSNSASVTLLQVGRSPRRIEMMNCQSAFLESYRPPLDGERYLTDGEVSELLRVSRRTELLRVSRRTLQEYRNNRVLPFILLGGKVLYPETGLRGVLEANYRKPLE